MKQRIRSSHWADSEGKPAGGVTEGVGFTISWQNGPLGRGEGRLEPNGAFVEAVIQAAIDRLEWYQGTQFACRENDQAIGGLEAALASLEERTRSREERGVEGTHAK